MTSVDWPTYLGAFHGGRPGITEAVLGRCRADEESPYGWLAAGVAADGLVLDLACGSGPLRPIIGGGWVGVDVESAELMLARHGGGDARLCRADTAALPFRTSGADALVCSMGLMVVPSTETTLGEVARVAVPGASIAFLVPASGPLTGRDRVRYGRLLWALRIRRFAYPVPAAVSDPVGLLNGAGFVVSTDDSRRFSYPVADRDAADALVDSLYLPQTTPQRVDAARMLVRRWIGSDLGVPLRRVLVTHA